MMIEQSTNSTVERRRSALLDGPVRLCQPLLFSNTVSGGGGIFSSTRSSPFVSAPVQQPFASNSVASVVTAETLSSPSLSCAVDSGSVKRRKGLLSTPVKVKNGVLNQEASPKMCVSCKSKLRLNGRGEYVCTSCGKIQPRASSSVSSLVGVPLLRKVPSASDSDNTKAQKSNGESGKTRRLPALLELPRNAYRVGNNQATPVPLISLSTLAPSTTTAPTSLLALMTPNRRILFPSSRSEEKSQPQPVLSPVTSRPNGCQPKTESSNRSSKRHHPYSRADYVRGADLKLAESSSSSLKKSKSRTKLVDKETTMDVDQQDDLVWLYQHRAAIDQRIAQLQSKHDRDSKSNELVGIQYAIGYYCYACRRFLPESYDSRLAHSLDETHIMNLASGNYKDEPCSQETDSVFKYYEERYECIAFDGDETDVTTPEDSTMAGNSGSAVHDAASTSTSTEANHISPMVNGCQQEKSESKTIKDESQCQQSHVDDMDYEELLLRAAQHSLPIDQKQSDDEEEFEELSKYERFDRTKISRC